MFILLRRYVLDTGPTQQVSAQSVQYSVVFEIYSKISIYKKLHVQNRSRYLNEMLSRLSNARYWDLHFGTSFFALHTLFREIIPNTIHTYIPTYTHTNMTWGRISLFVGLRVRVFDARSPSKKEHYSVDTCFDTRQKLRFLPAFFHTFTAARNV